MATWIDFKLLRSKLSFVDVLKHYGVEPKVKGERAYAFCPLPSHPSRTDGKKRTASLSINLTRNIFQCFGCKASGNVLEFCAFMEGMDPADPEQFRQAAIKVAGAFGITFDGKSRTATTSKQLAKAGISANRPETTSDSVPMTQPAIIVNAPLDFELKHLDPKHSYLSSRGFTPKTIEHFGLGFCAKGMMKDRIAIPLHDGKGQLVGYAGRLASDEQVSDEVPKYLFPGTREREGKRCEFHKSELLYNLHRLPQHVQDLVVVEGFASVWWLHQHGWPHAVALMGNSLSEPQATLVCDLLKPDGCLWILGDGDEAGRQCALAVLDRVSPHRFVRWAKLQKGQPTDLTGDDLAALLPSD